jgi:hypothetical protein
MLIELLSVVTTRSTAADAHPLVEGHRIHHLLCKSFT